MDASCTSPPPQEATAAENSAPAGELFAMQTVLVVDDEPLIRWAIREGLEGAGYAVVEAGSAGEALAHVAGPGRFAVALLDLRLPDCDDLTLLRRVRDAAPGCRIIMMTAHGTAETLAEAMRSGAVATIAKPFDLGGVVGLVRRAGAAA